jgi:hypothetical protein
MSSNTWARIAPARANSGSLKDASAVLTRADGPREMEQISFAVCPLPEPCPPIRFSTCQAFYQVPCSCQPLAGLIADFERIAVAVIAPVDRTPGIMPDAQVMNAGRQSQLHEFLYVVVARWIRRGAHFINDDYKIFHSPPCPSPLRLLSQT